MPNISFKERWASQAYKQKYVISIISVLVLLILMPYGFSIIQNRGGILWNDLLLNILHNLHYPLQSLLRLHYQ